MASKRTIKKQIHYLCGDIAGESILAKALLPGVDTDKLTDVVVRTARLQTEALARVNVKYDKTPRQFASRSEYNVARSKFFKAAFESIREGFNKQVAEIVKEMNSAVPANK